MAEITDISKVLGYSAISEEFILTHNGDITFLYELSLPDVLSLERENFSDMIKKFSGYLKNLGDDVVVHKMDCYWAEPNSMSASNPNITVRNDLDHFSGRSELNHKCYVAISYPSSNESTFPTSTKTSSIGLSKLIKGDPFKDIKNAIPDAEKMNREFQTFVNGNDYVSLRPIIGEEIYSVVMDLFNGTFDNDKLNSVDTAFNSVSIEEGFVRNDSDYIGIRTFNYEPTAFYSSSPAETVDPKSVNPEIRFSSKFMMPASISYPIGIGLPIKHVVHTIIEKKNSSALADQLKKGNYAINFMRSLGSPEARTKEQEIASYINNIAGEDGALFKQSVVLYAKNEKELETKMSISKSCYDMVGEGVQSLDDKKQTGNLFFACLPGMAREHWIYSFSTVRRGLVFWPWETLRGSDPNGHTFTTLHDARCVYDLWVGTNKNGVIFGPSGFGKSVFGNNLTSQGSWLGWDINILDKGASYEANVFSNGGKYIDAGKRSNLSFNIFECDRDEKNRYIYHSTDTDGDSSVDKPLLIRSIINTLIIRDENSTHLRSESQEVLLAAVSTYYNVLNKRVELDDKVEPSFTHFVKWFKEEHFISINQEYRRFFDIDSFMLLVDRFINEGEFAYLLNGESSFDVKKDRFICADVKAIEKDELLMRVFALLFADSIERKLASLPLEMPKVFIIDEALDFLQTKGMGKFVAELYRKIRKSGGAVWIATQEAAFMDACDKEVKDSILANANFKVCLGLKSEESVSAARRLLGLSETEIARIKTLVPKRELAMKIGDEMLMIKNELSPRSLATFTTDPSELGEIKRLVKEFDGDWMVAINNYFEKHRN